MIQVRLFRKYVTPKPASWLVIGLGNPGNQYVATRHNVGYRVVDRLLKDTPLHPIKGIPATAANVSDMLLVRSTTYMNDSGRAIVPLADAFTIDLDHIIVIHDELDLPLGTVRIKQGGNENGHNGLKSATAELGSRDYIRVRVGISRPPQGTPVVDYVLSTLPEGPDTDDALACAAQAVTLITTKGVSAAQNQIH